MTQLLARIPRRGASRFEWCTASVRSAAVKVGPSGCPPGTADAALLTAAPLPLCGDEVRLSPDWGLIAETPSPTKEGKHRRRREPQHPDRRVQGPVPPLPLQHQAEGSRASSPIHTDAPRPAPEAPLPTRSRGRPRKIERPQRFPQREQHPINILSPAPEPTRGSRTKVSMGARAQTVRTTQRSHAPPKR
jgi:hypothetical protein